MSASLYQFLEWRHLLFGVEPPIFLIEVCMRIAVLYATLVVAMRMMGRRMSSQLSRNELLALVSLAGASGPAVQDPTRGLLPPLVCAAVIVMVQRLHARMTVHSERVEQVLHSDPCVLVQDGRVLVQALHRNGVSRERLFAQLRAADIMDLGAVERVYLEPNGAFTIMRRHVPVPGLSLIPAWDVYLVREQGVNREVRACCACGATTSFDHADGPCPHCGSLQWGDAVGGQSASPQRPSA